VPPVPVTLRYDAAGNLLQTIRDTNAGGAALDVDAAGNSYLAGAFFATPGASSVAKYDADGAVVWSGPLTMAPSDAMTVVGVAADSGGTVTVAGSVADIFTGRTDYLTIRYAADGSELWRHRFAGAADGRDEAVALVVATNDDALVAGTSWNGYQSIGGTANDIVTLRFAAGAAPTLRAPTNLQATALSADVVRLAWQDNSGVEDGFRIERCKGVGCANFAEVATVGHDVAMYVDEGLSRLTTYRYRVRTFNAGGSSAYSNTESVKTKRR
ncbi:MAG: fibronectin type III domain-containing protein, partial [Acidimicrobiales bacterium]